MLFSIKGNLVYKDHKIACIDVNGVTYEVNIPLRLFFELPELNEMVKLFTLMLSNSENNFEIYGFKTLEEKDLFSKFTKVSGIGPKTTLNLFSKLEYEEILNAIEENDDDRLSSVPGIGKKTAGRIILELSGKLVSVGKEKIIDESYKDTLQALKNLGYKERESEKIIKEVLRELEGEKTTEIILKESLKRLAEQ